MTFESPYLTNMCYETSFTEAQILGSVGIDAVLIEMI